MQPVLELQVAEDDGREVLAAHGVDGAALVRVELLAFHQVIDEQGALTIEQAAIQIELLRLLSPRLVAALVDDVDQRIEQDQQQGDDRRSSPIQGLIGRENDHRTRLSRACYRSG
ncbi:hypothetical protein D3C85_1629960 [compost metagenome]